MPRERSFSRCGAAMSEKTSTTPTGRRRSTPSIQSGGGRVAVAAHGEHDREPGRVRDLLDALDDLHRPAALELVEDQLDELGALR